MPRLATRILTSLALALVGPSIAAAQLQAADADSVRSPSAPSSGERPAPIRILAISGTTTTDVLAWHTRSAEFTEGAVRGRALTRLAATLDPGAFTGWRGATVGASAMALIGADQTATLEAAHGGTNIDAAPFANLFDLWLEQSLGARMRLKLGRIDANSEFVAPRLAAGFLTPAMAVDPTVIALPSYPAPTLGINLFAMLGTVRLGAGLYDGHRTVSTLTGARRGRAANALFAIAQADVEWDDARGRLAVGAWRHSGRFDRAGAAARLHGAYALGERTFWAPAAGRSLGAYLQAGVASTVAGGARRHLGAGLAASGVRGAAARDGAGLALSLLGLDGGDDEEGVLELYYATPLTSAITLVTDLALVRHAGGDAARGIRAAFNLRVVVTP